MVDETPMAPPIAQTRRILGADVFAAAQAAGRALDYDQATTEVRAWLDRPTGR